MLLHSLSVLFVLSAAAQGAAAPSSHVVHEKRTQAMKTWVKRDRLAPKAILPMRIGLAQQNLEKIDEYLMDVSNPHSSNYGKHWTSDQVIEAFAPKQETVDSVKEWLIDHGITDDRITHSDNKGWLAFDATAEEAESLLHTTYHVYEHSETAHKTLACDSYHVPKVIQEHIDYITPGVKISVPHKELKSRKRDINSKRAVVNRQSDLAECDQLVTPDCIRALYEVPPTPEYPNGVPLSSNTLGIYASGDYYLQSDLDDWFTVYQPNVPNGTHPIPAPIDGAVITGNGDPIGNNAGGESDLDLTLGISLIYPQKTTLYQVDDTYYESIGNYTAYFNTFLDALDGSYCTYSAYGETGNDPFYDPKYPDTRPNGYNKPLQCGVYKPTNVISISYGIQEAELPAYYQQRQCNEWAKLGLQGTSVILASGDTGVAGPSFSSVYGNGCLGNDGTVFNPGFPNTCPYITNVGATQINSGATVYEPESAANDQDFLYSTGGGFSNIFPAPSYQQAALQTYFSQHNPNWLTSYGLGTNQNGNYNRTGRGYPDVAANGLFIAAIVHGLFFPTYGTSASAPIFAAMINRINEVRLHYGKGPLGFLNPAMYANPNMFNDITSGFNPGCNTQGFEAVTGWDPLTGLGTPSYERMLGIFTSLP